MTLSLLFSFFSNLMLAYYAPEKSEQGIAAQLGLRNAWQARDYMAAMRKYSAVKVMYIISDIRECDAKSKGVGNPSTDNGDLLKELIYKILHWFNKHLQLIQHLYTNKDKPYTNKDKQP